MKEKIKKILFLVLITIAIIVGWYYFRQKKWKSECLLLYCQYDLEKKVWGYFPQYPSGPPIPARIFPTQDQCIDYCVEDMKYKF